MRRVMVTSLLCLLAGCVAEPSLDDEIQAVKPEAPEDAPWIVNPGPGGPAGKWNCTFPINAACIRDFHPDNYCWEHAVGHGGFIRQEQSGVHCTNLAGCPAGGDINVVRLCHPDAVGVGNSMDTPCGPTGPRGCAVCDPIPEAVCD